MKALLCALGVSLVPVAVSAATYQDVESLVAVDALEDADSDWRRLMAQQKSDCGYYGRQTEVRRVDVLVDRFNALADAVESNDEDAAMAAGKSLYAAIDANDRFSSCWRHVSRKAGVPSKLTRVLREI